MRVAISGEWLGTHAGGPEVYVSNLVRQLARLGGAHQFKVLVSEKHAHEELSRLAPHVEPRLMAARSRWLTVPLLQPFEVARNPVDLFHATFAAPPLCPAPLVLTVVELGFERVPEFYPRGHYLRLSALLRWGAVRARRIIAISEHTKRDLIELYGVDESRITVVPLGVSSRFQEPLDPEESARVLAGHGVAAPYILYVGKLEIRKNVPRLLEAFHRLRTRGFSDLELVIVGDRSYLYSEVFSTLDRLRLNSSVHILEKLERWKLPHFYSAARAFVFPSLLEAFGLPVVEAMASGAPVVVSNAAALPEVAGDAALLCDATDPDAIADAVSKVLDDAELRGSLIAKGRRRAAAYSWERTGSETLRVYEEVHQALHSRHRARSKGRAA